MSFLTRLAGGGIKTGPRGLLPADACLRGSDKPLASAPDPHDAHGHFIKKTPLYPPFYKDAADPKKGEYDYAVFGMGCFWCSENLFMRLQGVHSTHVGYAGGHTPNASYQDVCSGRTNHNEVVRVIFDPEVIKYEELLRIFWEHHDPTTFHQQGGDRGSQYRSGVYYYGEEQRQTAENSKEQFQQDIVKGYNAGKIVSTEILDAQKSVEEDGLGTFYYAEENHQQYDARPGSRNYCGLKPLGVAYGSSKGK